MRNYHRRVGPPSCAMKVDIRKACDSVEWDFIEEMMLGLEFVSRFIRWVMRKKGLRQGNSMSPLLFVIAMEYLSRYLEGRLLINFKFHKGCGGI